MKHLFHIHSYTCYITSVGILDKENIATSDAIFFIYRSVPIIRKDIKHVFIEDKLYYFPFFTNRKLVNFKFLKTKEIINKFDKIINNEVGDKYIYYVHNSRSYLYRIFITHKSCEEVRFIEDGLDVFLEKKSFYKKYPYKVRIRHKIINFILGYILGPKKVYARLKQYNDPFKNKNEVSRFYGLTQKSFSHFLPDNSKYQKIDSKIVRSIQNYKIEQGANLFVFSALVEQHVSSQEDIDKLLKWFVKKFDINELFINFHPHQQKSTRDSLVSLLVNENVDVKIIPDNIIMETFFLNNKDLNIFGTGTSLLIYAAYFSPSSNVFVLYPYFKNHLNKVTIRTKFWANTFENMHKDNLYLYLRDFE